MGKKNLIVIAIVLIILVVTGSITYQSYGYVKLMKNQVDTLNGVIQEKDAQIAKLTQEIKAKEDELGNVKAQLDTVKKITSEANVQINKVAEQPIVQESQPVVAK
ncbi:MAG: hypothetical protein Q7S42_02715 [Candidatus Omnitrophota bacterium]|nr:hypothetical protein [Candidatus Omnitrophota bacterium]